MKKTLEEKKLYKKQWYETHRELSKKRARESYQRNREHAIAMEVERNKKKAKVYSDYLKTLACSECGSKDQLVLHHIDKTTKLFAPHRAVFHTLTIRLEELKKCIPLCRSCHAKVHYVHIIGTPDAAK